MKEKLKMAFPERSRFMVAAVCLTATGITSIGFGMAGGETFQWIPTGILEKVIYAIVVTLFGFSIWQLFLMQGHCKRSRLSFEQKVMWWLLILIYPAGPLLYYLAVYRRHEEHT